VPWAIVEDEKKLTWFTKGLRRPPFFVFLIIWSKETDLIYEGIATGYWLRWECTKTGVKETDLIYEGIATHCPMPVSFSSSYKETDLIYEGIATSMYARSPKLTSQRNWPDLRRDCDALRA